MTSKEYNKMINEAVREFEGMNANYRGVLVCLMCTSINQRYMTKEQVIKAKERIDLLRRLKALDLLK